MREASARLTRGGVKRGEAKGEKGEAELGRRMGDVRMKVDVKQSSQNINKTTKKGQIMVFW